MMHRDEASIVTFTLAVVPIGNMSECDFLEGVDDIAAVAGSLTRDRVLVSSLQVSCDRVSLLRLRACIADRCPDSYVPWRLSARYLRMRMLAHDRPASHPFIFIIYLPLFWCSIY